MFFFNFSNKAAGAIQFVFNNCKPRSTWELAVTPNLQGDFKLEMNKIKVWWMFQLCFNFNRIHDSVGSALWTANQDHVTTNSHALSSSFDSGFSQF
jgi:hypothetical protein